MTELVFLPLIILVFNWKNYDLYNWLFTVFYVIYAFTFLMTDEIPLNARIGSFYLGIPALSYCVFVLSEFQSHYSVYTIKLMSALGLSAALISLLIIF
ncbi:hypothetical protein ACPFTZ_001899 [Vibrio cholerae]|uniref:hypothetical protein n=1 Tax=Vibrio cholerae TaxID=666 RepID=UPI000DE4C614|nr:hypothetical protein [Vibrio cholerae]NAR39715.1 hypothetical protein [Vibrio cholerae]RBM64400.1 hypothetical protein DLR71_05400 [Vibrio paracholerae]GIC26408.1 hypothetical protein VCSRO146_2941 [Vibrio cholerae]